LEGIVCKLCYPVQNPMGTLSAFVPPGTRTNPTLIVLLAATIS